MRNGGLDEAGIKIARRSINDLKYADDITLIEESKEEVKSLLKNMKEESDKAGLKLSIQKMKIMACGPITSCQIDGDKMETLFSWAPKSLQMVAASMNPELSAQGLVPLRWGCALPSPNVHTSLGGVSSAFSD